MKNKLAVEEWAQSNDAIANIEDAISKLTKDNYAIIGLLSVYKEWVRREIKAREALEVESWDETMSLWAAQKKEEVSA